MADVKDELKGEVRNVIRRLMNEQFDVLEEDIRHLRKMLQVTEKALYIACSDYYSLHYPNGHRSVEDIYNDYIKAATEETDD